MRQIPPGASQPLQAHGHVHAAAVDVVWLDDHITEIDAQAKLDAMILPDASVAHDQGPLNCYCASNRIDHVPEFDKSAVAGVLDDSTSMLVDDRSLIPRRTSIRR